MSIFQFNPDTFFPKQESPGDIGNSAIDAFYAGQQNSRANQGMKNENERLGMQKQTFAAGMEENEYNKTQRPINELSAQLGVAQQGLQIANQSISYQRGLSDAKVQAMGMAQTEKNLRKLDDFDQKAASVVQQAGQANGWSAKLPPGLQPLASTFEEAGRKYGINPSVLAAISAHETAGGSSNAFRNKNNAMGISNATGPIAFADAKESIFQQARSLAGKTYKGADDVESIGAIYAPPGAGNDPGNLNPHWSSGVKRYLKEFTGSDAVPVRVSDALSGGTGVPSLTHAVAATSPNGTPLVAVAANSLNPGAVITQALSPNEQWAMAEYDEFSVMAQTGATPEERSGAAARMLAMKRHPDFMAATAKRVEMEKAVTNQIQMNGMLQEVPLEYIEAFNSAYGDRYSVRRQKDGQFMLFNAQTDQPANSQEQVHGFGAFKRFTDSYDPAKVAAARSAEINKVLPLYSVIRANGIARPPAALPAPPVGKDDKPLPTDSPEYKVYFENVVKPHNAATLAYRGSVSKVAGAVAELEYLAGVGNAEAKSIVDQLKPQQQVGPPAPEETGSDQAPTPPAKKSIRDLADSDEKKQAKREIDDEWTRVKTDFQSKLELDYPDNGRDGGDNPALTLAAKIHENKAGAIDAAAKIIGVKSSDPLGKVATGFGSRTLKINDVAKAWAEDILRKYGYMDGGGTAAPAGGSNIIAIREKQ